MLEIKNLNFYYGNNHILKNISFNAESGSLWGLMGPNGSGKTTFFKCILGLLKHTGSQIKINHLDYEKLNTSKLAKLISYVPQEHKPPFPFYDMNNIRIQQQRTQDKRHRNRSIPLFCRAPCDIDRQKIKARIPDKI